MIRIMSSMALMLGYLRYIEEKEKALLMRSVQKWFEARRYSLSKTCSFSAMLKKREEGDTVSLGLNPCNKTTHNRYGSERRDQISGKLRCRTSLTETS